MKRADLKALCVWYRSMGVEVIPLVQSFGHAQWLSRGDKNLDLFLNPKVPFTLDPSKPQVAKLMTQLWAEVIAVTQPKTVHFGLDEVDFRGIPKDPAFVTTLWKAQVPLLARIAKHHQVGFMLWGDEVLAPGEGALPASAPNAQVAKARRSVLPEGAYVCDWHYQNDANPELYAKSLRLLKGEGFRPIASAWWRPRNIGGQNLAATRTGAGSLLTTWAGYELNEKVMRGNLRQFGAMVLAADHAWEWKGEPSYDAGAIFLDMLR